MQKVPFVKMHGLGNDFVIMTKDQLPDEVDINKFAALVSDRRRGIGCDQFITYNQDDATNISMDIYNQDGSSALACGNASRCLSRLMFDQTGTRKITLNVSGRRVECDYINANEVKINMGPVRFEKDWMPSPAELWKLAERHLIEPKEMICVDVANPHLVIFSKLSDQDQEIIGQSFQDIGLFKDGVNINFATIVDDQINLKVWERGAGFTSACGSGAIATFAAANKLGFAGDNADIIFTLGFLKMQKHGDNITMRGPASYVFSGEFIYE